MRWIYFAAVVLLAACSSPDKVDFVLVNANIYTVDDHFSTAEALAVKDGKILALGTTASIKANYEATEIIDAKGAFVYPGFIDAHAHFLGYGQSLFSVNLFNSKSWDEAVERIAKFAGENKQQEWITGRGWDQNLWSGKQFPTNEKLNALFPDKPAVFSRVDGHALVANNKALEIAGITATTNISGGSVELLNGKPTGLLVDNAMNLIFDKMPPAGRKQYQEWLTAAQANCFSVGLTTVADCGLMFNDIEMIDSLQQENIVKMPVYAMLSDDKRNYDLYLKKGPYKTNLLYVKGIKFYSDGALGSRGACLLQPYSDKPGWRGFMLKNESYFDSMAALIAKTDFQMCTHAIGDSANRTILKVYQKHLVKGNDKRWRIEHAQVINPADFSFFKAASIVPSVQPTHATSDMHWAGERLGSERLKTAYAYKQLLQQNGWIALGTDFPVEDINPFRTFYAAVARKDAKGQPEAGFQKQNALSRTEALKGMTIWAAKSCFLETETGSLEKGKLANFIILNKDLLKINEKEILATEVLSTFVHGKRVYAKKATKSLN